MSDRNQVTQTARLNAKPYTDGVKAIKDAARSAITYVNKELFHHKQSWQDTTNEVKKSASSMQKELLSLGKGFAANLGKGTLLGAAGAGISLVRQSARAGAADTLEFSKNFQALAYKANLADSQISKLRKTMLDLGKSGAQIATLPSAFEDLFSYSKSTEKAMDALSPISQAAAMGNGDAGEVAHFVTSNLAGRGLDVNGRNTRELLTAVVRSMKAGNFRNIGDAMSAFGGVDADKLRQSGLSSNEFGALLAGGSLTGGSREQSVAAMNALVAGANTGFAGNAVLKGILGADLFKGGRVNLAGFRAASSRVRGLGSNDAQRKQILQDTAGLSESEAAGLLGILRNVDRFAKGVEGQRKATDTISSAFEKTTDDLGHNVDRLQNKLETGVGNILHPLEKPFNELVKGNVGAAVSGLPHAIRTGGYALKDNAGTALAGVAATAAAGALASKLSGMFFGGKGALPGGVAMGKALQQAGVTPVYVVNAREIGESTNSADSQWQSWGKTITGGGAATGAARLGLLSKLGLMGAAAAGGTLAGATIADAQVERRRNAIEQGGVVETSKLDALYDLIANGILMLTQKPVAQSVVKVEVDSKDPGLSVKPKASDNNRRPH